MVEDVEDKLDALFALVLHIVISRDSNSRCPNCKFRKLNQLNTAPAFRQFAVF